jgi:hypothetical protein
MSKTCFTLRRHSVITFSQEAASRLEIWNCVPRGRQTSSPLIVPISIFIGIDASRAISARHQININRAAVEPSLSFCRIVNCIPFGVLHPNALPRPGKTLRRTLDSIG